MKILGLLVLLCLWGCASAQTATCCYTKTNNPDGSTLYSPVPAATPTPTPTPNPTPTPAPTPSTQVSLLALAGDSITAGNGSAGGLNYPNILASLLVQSGDSSWKIVNKGVPGQTLDTMIATGPTDIDPLYGSGYAHNVLIFFAGTNDIDLNGQTAAHVYAAQQQYGNARRAVGWTVITVDMLPRSAGDEASRTALNASILGDFNVATSYPNVWKPKPGVTWANGLIDLGGDTNIGMFNENMGTFYDPDHIHPNSAGYWMIAPYAYHSLRALGLTP